jgi:hypothetical protein
MLAVSSGGAQAATVGIVDVKALAQETQRLTNYAGQFYLAWWVPQTLAETMLRAAPNVSQTDVDQMLRGLEPYMVFALSRGQEGVNGLEDLQNKAELLSHSRLTVNGQLMKAAPADQDDPAAQPGLAAIKSALVSMLGSANGRGVEFALYRWPPDVQPLDPALSGKFEYVFYHKHYLWHLPVWAPAAPQPTRAAVVAPLATVPPAAPATPVPPVARAMPVAPPAAAPAVVAPGNPAAAPAVPVQRRKVDPVTGEEFPERYDYNPYTGQRLVSQ